MCGTGDGGRSHINYVTMRVTMNQRYPTRMRYLDSGNATNFTSPSTAPAGSPKSNAFSPAVVAVIGVLAGAFLILSYYRIFLRYCNSHRFSFWGPRSDARNGGPSTIVSVLIPWSKSSFPVAVCACACAVIILLSS